MHPRPRQSGLSWGTLYFGAAAGVFFTAASVIFFRPASVAGKHWQMLVPAASIIGGWGCFVLSRRWLNSFWASAVAGIAYGFSPFLLSFRIYHPLAGLGVAALPWLFCPAALWNRYTQPSIKVHLRRLPLLLLPFVWLLLFYWLPAQPWVGPYSLMPSAQQLRLADLGAILEFPSAATGQILVGFYANALILAVMGLFVYSFLLRVMVLAAPLAGLVLAFCGPILDVPPIVWAALPMLFLSVLAGLGAQAMVLAGPGDRKWIFACLCLAAFLAAAGIVLAFSRPDGQHYWMPAAMYGLSFVTVGVICFLCTKQLRLTFLRWLLVGTALGINLSWTGQTIIASL